MSFARIRPFQRGIPFIRFIKCFGPLCCCLVIEATMQGETTVLGKAREFVSYTSGYGCAKYAA